jgi:hypothetical protein
VTIRFLWRIAGVSTLIVSLLAISTSAIAAPARDDTTWHAEYFNNTTLSGKPALVREEAIIARDWKLGSPGPSVRVDNFSARWTRTMDLGYSGNYRIYINSDDGMRVWVDDILVIDNWFDRQDAWSTTVDVYLAAGTHRFKVEYYEHVGSALAYVVIQPEGDGTGAFWHAEYFVNPDLEDDPGLTDSVSDLSLDWGSGSPGQWIPARWFSARFTRDAIFSAGMYQFLVTTEGGVRLYVDDVLILDQWHETDKTTYTANMALTTAAHRVRLEYMDTWRNASISLRWQPAGISSTAAWQGEYFSSETPGTTPIMVRADKAIDFDWGTNAPSTGLPSEHWSARWTRSLSFAAGYYRFTTVTDDGVRLWVDDKLLIDQWAPNDGKPFFGDAYLASGPHAVKMEYYNLTGKAMARLTWTKMNTTDTTAIVDDGALGFTTGGATSGWHTAYYGYGGRSRWTDNRAGFWARWTPALPRPAHYEVLVYIPGGTNRTSSAHYYLRHEGEVVEFKIDQRAKAGQWVSLGTYTFNANNTEFVHLDAVTGEPAGTRTVGFDAVKWVYRGP